MLRGLFLRHGSESIAGFNWYDRLHAKFDGERGLFNQSSRGRPISLEYD